MDIITIAICAIICRCNAWEEVEDFARMDYKKFEKCFIARTQEVCRLSKARMFIDLDQRSKDFI
ncbi:MAG: hypothetical protein DKM50_07090 [Candidatus Margulisiibacteriota bacterium]|nr:MAG: hypothetical protein DKM50_07090 [Candidatus Margulisiibacteriota bacterium]HAR62401.1 hypothetical protein [Candidatus Margulisiibacteriota bacterium]HCT86023.1 hypothetical protein [Candidatus Margulisiibacteriota bacterium]HCY37505.1 hypothetical protein [Candidatus Margulisiibacteriota bacterium]